MNEKLKQYLNEIFLPYEDIKAIKELKEELYNDLQEKLNDLKNEGHDEESAYSITIDSIGDITEIIEGINAKTRELQQRVGMDFSKSNLKNSDLKSVSLQNGRFSYSNLCGSDFSNSDLRGGKFDYSSLPDSNFSHSDLSGSSFKCSNLDNSVFDAANLTDAKINKSNLKGVSFKDCIFNRTDFSYSDLSGVSFDNQKFNGTIFNCSGLRGTSFRNAEFINVSFKTDVKKAVFDGATMDKLTYALLKGYKARLDNVKVI